MKPTKKGIDSYQESPPYMSTYLDNDSYDDDFNNNPYQASSSRNSPDFAAATNTNIHETSLSNRLSERMSRDFYSESSSRIHNKGHEYPGSESDSNGPLSEANTTRSSMMPPAQSGYAVNLDLFGSLRNPKLSDSRYARYAPSTESLLALIESKKPQYPNQSISSFSRASSWVSEANQQGGYFDLPGHRSLAKDYPWPAWSAEHQVPLSKEEIWEIFLDLKDKFGFQADSIRNQYDALMTMLDSRASRMTPTMALLTLHADYIGGKNSNYTKWFFSAQFNKDSTLLSGGRPEKEGKKDDLDDQMSADNLEDWWRNKMSKITQQERIRQIGLYLCIWGEALNIRYLPEAICFIFKISYDYYLSNECQSCQVAEEGSYMRTVVTPLYNYIRDTNYEVVNGTYLKREKDHAQIIGYDDINETFWSKEGVFQLVLNDKKTKLMNLAPHERYLKMGEVDWKRSFVKTYYERRTWLHILTNFSRVWIFHIATFYFFWIFNSPFMFIDIEIVKARSKNDPNFEPYTPLQLSAMALGGAIAAYLAASATFFEFFFVQKKWSNYKTLLRRWLLLCIILVVNVVPFFALYFMFNVKIPDDADTVLTPKQQSKQTIATIIAAVHIPLGIVTTIVLTIIPPASLFNRNPGITLENSSRNGIINRAFTADYAKLSFSSRATSISMWALICICKLVESYISLILSFKNALRALVYVDLAKCKDALLGSYACKYMGTITLVMMVLLLLIMFFLDTYLWYIIVTSLFSIAQAFSMGISILSPWKNIFSRLPKRIYTKILATSNMEIKLRPKMLCSQVWNAIIISMYRDHLISIEHVQKLLYQQVASDIEGKKKLKPPTFFVSQEDTSVNAEFYPPGSEAERRISFFASSLSTVIPDPLPVENMPTFTVFTPHYAEKILLSLREIIREDDQFTRVTMLEYLKSLYSVEWDNFVKDTKILAEENAILTGEEPTFENEVGNEKAKTDDLPFYSVGFKSAAPEFTLRTRIWASLRSQTLYRTISGFMNYSKALKLLHRIENPELVHILGGNTEALEQELDLMSRRKFNFLISMQRFTKFNKEEKENVDFLLKTYPDLQVAYLDEIQCEVEGESSRMFSCLIDGHCEVNENGDRIAKYRVEIPGNPILGDGKSDNQNHAIIFTRGEYLQVIDANQDNYLEEALKIRSVLAEFDEYQAPTHSPYAPFSKASSGEEEFRPVAIVGAREYIFSENIGVLGDIAAGKEQTFGTLTHRIMATVGGRLHYGHPDFLNLVFMNTRGGVSKAQKGLHLNEDIYAGMTALQRGGRIKHSEYIQCGKGRDLGFCSVLNFNTKIGTGMGEQLLAREYYYLYTQLPLDRFLTLFYAHPGFHVNNMMIMFTIQTFLIAAACLAVLVSVQKPCPDWVNEATPISSTQDEECFNRFPITKWVERTIFSVFVVLFITFLPLILQVLSEQGFVRMAARLGKQVISCAPMFEIFTTQIYSNSILQNMSFGGARYIGTGRGFATTRQSFSVLFSRFAASSIYSGMRNSLLLLFVCFTIWVPHFLYFWFTIAGMVLSPWVFNPHQFSGMDFILDYRYFLNWLSAGNSSTAKDSWVAHCRYARTRITGQKRKRLGDKERKIGMHVPRANRAIIFYSEVFLPLVFAVITVLIYSVTDSFSDKDAEVKYIMGAKGGSGAARAVVAAVLPIGINAGVLLALFPVSLFLGPIMSMCAKSFGNIIAAIAHAFAVLTLIVSFMLLWVLENWYLPNAVLGITAAMFLQRAIFALLTFLFLTREFGHDGANVAWWTGKWFSAGLGWMAVTQPLREFVCKIIEMSLFATDYIIAHIIWIILSMFCLIPFIDKWHSTMLFWLRPSRQIRPPIYSLRQRAQRRRRAIFYGILLGLNCVFFLCIIAGPLFLQTKLQKTFSRKQLGVLTNLKL